MSDGHIQPCLQESEEWPNMYHDIERQRSELEEVSYFERAAQYRWDCQRENAGQLSGDELREHSDLVALTIHSEPPRIHATTSLAEHVVHGRSQQWRQRQKMEDTTPFRLPFSLLVARPVSRNEYIGDAKAMEAYWKEWQNLEAKQTWDWDTLREWHEVSAEAKEQNVEAHFGYLFGIMVEKGSEYPKGDPRRYFKYRVVFQGNRVKDQNYEVALFNEMASTPATIGASRTADMLT